MDREEMKAALRDVITNLIRDNEGSGEAATKGLHDVLAAKMRERVNPTTDDTHQDTVDDQTDDVVDDDDQVTDDDNKPDETGEE
jgi:hypothetical protein